MEVLEALIEEPFSREITELLQKSHPEVMVKAIKEGTASFFIYRKCYEALQENVPFEIEFPEARSYQKLTNVFTLKDTPYAQNLKVKLYSRDESRVRVLYLDAATEQKLINQLYHAREELKDLESKLGIKGEALQQLHTQNYTRIETFKKRLTQKRMEKTHERMQFLQRVKRQTASELIQSNLGFICDKTRKEYEKWKYKLPSDSFQDFLCQGYAGFLRALDSFDPGRGKLTTYSAFWIRAYVGRAAEATKQNVRLPYDSNAQRRKAKESQDESKFERYHIKEMHLDQELYPGSDKTLADRLSEDEVITEQVIRHELEEQIKQLKNAPEARYFNLLLQDLSTMTKEEKRRRNVALVSFYSSRRHIARKYPQLREFL